MVTLCKLFGEAFDDGEKMTNAFLLKLCFQSIVKFSNGQLGINISTITIGTAARFANECLAFMVHTELSAIWKDGPLGQRRRFQYDKLKENKKLLEMFKLWQAEFQASEKTIETFFERLPLERSIPDDDVIAQDISANIDQVCEEKSARCGVVQAAYVKRRSVEKLPYCCKRKRAIQRIHYRSLHQAEDKGWNNKL